MPRLCRRGRRSEGIQNQCYHLIGGDNGIPSGIGGNCNYFKNNMSQRATNARNYANSPKFPSFKRVFGRNKTFDMEERKTFISSGCNHLWQDKLYGITRVGVYGVQSICVVTRSEDLEQLEEDLIRLQDSDYGGDFIPQALINEVEDLACPPGEHRFAERRNQKPFGVVSVIPGTNEVNHHEADELKAVEFLREKMNITSTFTLHKAVKTAIRALQLLWNKKFKPDEVQVFVWTKVKKIDEDSDNDGVQVLKMRAERSVSDILSVINDEPRSFADSAML